MQHRECEVCLVTVVAVLELHLRPDALHEGRQTLASVLSETSAFDGCLSIETLINREDETHLVVIERWKSSEHDAAYRLWRAGEGKRSDLGKALASRPTLSKYEVAKGEQ